MRNKRRDQFTLRTSKMSDEVYQFFENLSQQRRLTAFLIRAAEKELYEKQDTNQQVLDELREIKLLILHNRISVDKHPFTEGKQGSTPVIQLSNNEKKGSLDQNDVDYGDY